MEKYMNDLREKKVDGEAKYRGRIINVRLDEVELPSGNRSFREVVEHPGAVALLGETVDGELVLIRQFRYPTGETLIEIPAGKLENGESPEDCVRREMMEETGYKIGDLELLSGIYSTPGFCDEVIYIFRGYNLEYIKEPAGEDENGDEENLHTLLLTREEAMRMIKSGEIYDAKTVIALLWP